MSEKTEIIIRSVKDRENLTSYEKNFIDRTHHCPDCETGDLIEGPRGGMAVNYRCSNDDCGSEFNLTFYPSHLVFAERISDAQPKKAKS